MTTSAENVEKTTEAYDAGRRVAFGVSALALALVTFLSLLGAEKAILAIVLGTLAVKGPNAGTLSQQLGRAAIVLGTMFLLTVGVVLVVFWDQAIEFARLLQQLS
jgi:hypothetical protein